MGGGIWAGWGTGIVCACPESGGRGCCLPATHGLAGGLGISTAHGLVSPFRGWWLRQSWASRTFRQPQEMELDSLWVFSGAPGSPEDQAGRSGGAVVDLPILAAGGDEPSRDVHTEAMGWSRRRENIPEGGGVGRAGPAPSRGVTLIR